MSSAKRSHLAGWLSGQGIELGALHQPLAVPAGVHVEYVDRLSVAELRQQYPELASLDLVPVSHIGSAEDLAGIADAPWISWWPVICSSTSRTPPALCARSIACCATGASFSVHCPSQG
jgi:hypothetical protein